MALGNMRVERGNAKGKSYSKAEGRSPQSRDGMQKEEGAGISRPNETLSLRSYNDWRS